jgi:hypothetical protein
MVGFGADGVYVAITTPNQNANAVNLLSDFCDKTGWSVAKHVRLLGDINHDGHDDIVGFGDAGVYTALSTGTGFGPVRFVIPDFGYNQQWRPGVHTRLLADVNNDHNADIVAFGDDAVMLALADGAGGFRTPVAVNPEFTTHFGWTASKHVRTLADVNGDHFLDIVGFGDDGVSLALSTNGTGFGPAHFVLPSFGYNAGSWSLDRDIRVLGDINGDSYADIVAFGDDGVWTALSTVTGFAPARLVIGDFSYNRGWTVTGNPRFLTDLNGDGWLDLVGFGTSSVIRSLGGPAGFGPLLGVFRNFPVTSTSFDLLGDMNADGLPDLVSTDVSGTSTSLSSANPPPPIPAAPTNPHVVSVQGNEIQIAWSQPDWTNVQDFFVSWAAKDGSQSGAVSTDSQVTQGWLYDLEQGVEYCMTVQAESPFALSNPTPVFCSSTQPPPPNIIYWAETSTTLTIGFKDPGVDSVTTSISPAADPEETLSGDDVTRTFTNLKPNTKYCISAKASRQGGVSTQSTQCYTTLSSDPAGVDLYPQEVDLDDYYPHAGESVKATWIECVVGNVHPGSYVVTVAHDGAEIYRVTRPAGRAFGCAQSEPVTFTAPDTDVHHITVTVDANNDVAETNESDNTVDDGYGHPSQ